MRFLFRLAGIIVWVGFHICAVRAQIPVNYLQGLSGPWECVDSKGIHGVFVSNSTRITDDGGHQNIDWQHVSIFVYHRQNGKAEGGYFSTGSHDSRGGADFDGKRLMIYLNSASSLSPFNLDLELDVDAVRWRGFWTQCNSPGEAILERPREADGVSKNILDGAWEGDTDPTHSLVGRLHIQQSVDGMAMAWLDTVTKSRDYRSRVITIDQGSQQLLFESSGDNKFVLRKVPGVGPQYEYEGTLAADGKSISGEWRIQGMIGARPGGPHYPASTLFRRIE